MSILVRSVKFRMVLTFGLCVFMMAAIGGLSILGMSSLNNNLRKMYDDDLVTVGILSELRAAMYHLRLQTARFQIFRDAEERKLAAAEFRSDQIRIKSAWSAYIHNGIGSDDNKELSGKIANILPIFDAAAVAVLNATVSGDEQILLTEVRKLVPLGSQINELLDEASALRLRQAEHYLRASEARAMNVIEISILLMITGFAVVSIISIQLMKAISRPLGDAVDIACGISAGRLENRIKISKKDEFGALLEALQRMDGRLGAIVREIRSNSESVAIASNQIATGNADLSKRTEAQAASLEKTAASIVQLTHSIGQTADNALNASLSAKKAKETSESSLSLVRAMVNRMEEVGACSSKISEITGVIDGIAFQTNILALNAAVEAARAGSHGRGFAVVAGEVRGLAQRSSEAAKEIKVLISNSVTKIESGTRQASEVGVAMTEVKLAIQEVSDAFSEIVVASRQQADGVEHINHAVDHLDRATQENAALVEEVATAAKSLGIQANRLNEFVSVFSFGKGVVEGT